MLFGLAREQIPQPLDTRPEPGLQVSALLRGRLAGAVAAPGSLFAGEGLGEGGDVGVVSGRAVVLVG